VAKLLLFGRFFVKNRQIQQILPPWSSPTFSNHSSFTLVMESAAVVLSSFPGGRKRFQRTHLFGRRISVNPSGLELI
jgi:hypothetical protein